MKKTNIFIISIILLMNVASVTCAYSDTKNHWAEESINKMTENNILRGYSNDTFKPDSKMTRAEFVTIINRILGTKIESNKYVPDIKRQDWYYSEIRKAIFAGILKGDETAYVHPNGYVTREEAIVMLGRAFKIEDNHSAELEFIDKNEISSWATEYVQAFVNNNYITGYSDNTINPEGTITRAEVVTLLDRMFANILETNMYKGLITGNTVVKNSNIVLNNLTIEGDLIISDDALTTLTIKDTTINGNVILASNNIQKAKSLDVNGKIYNLYENAIEDTLYKNKEYGISFSIPNISNVHEIVEENIDYDANDLVVIDIKEDEKYFLKNIKTINKEEKKKYANLFSTEESGKIGEVDYILSTDKENAQILVMKRDNVVYTLIFFNITSENLVENVLATTEFYDGTNITEIKDVVYKNNKLSLKFNYKDVYVLVDDSYNTNIINEGNGLFKLFIQVNTITDIQNYNLNEIKAFLRSIVQDDGRIINTKTFKIMNNDAIQFELQAEEKKIYSLYVVVGNNLYNFIFTGEEYGMNEVGEDLFNDIVNTLEF